MRCKYFDSKLSVIQSYIECLYSIEGCEAGGMLHILLDDDNYDDDSIAFCLIECLKNPSKPESKIGKLICEEYLTLPIELRRLLRSEYIGHWSCFDESCENCLIQTGDEFEQST